MTSLGCSSRRLSSTDNQSSFRSFDSITSSEMQDLPPSSARSTRMCLWTMDKKAKGTMSGSSNRHKYTFCGCIGWTFRTSTLSAPQDVEDHFFHYAQNGVLGAAQLQQFLVQVQGEKNVSIKDAEEIIAAQNRDSHPLTHHLQAQGFNINTFLQFLLNPRLNPPINTEVHHDMTKPMSHYYVFTGHNSYLTGNQLSSDCSEKPIVKALLRGVRVIELDLWPNEHDENKINVKHGGTLTRPVDFETCIIAIKDNAFVASEYPLIITFEDHLSSPLQARVAKIVTEQFKDLLYLPSADTIWKEFPSPEALKRRILISTKPPEEYMTALEPSKVAGSKKEEKESQWGEEILEYEEQAERGAEKERAPAALDDFDAESSHAAPEYRRIITIHAGLPTGIPIKEAMAKVDEKVKRFSLSEPQLKNLCKNHSETVIRFTSRNFLRVYPYGLRFNSTNYNPFVGWARGAQMVAFNMQGYGRYLWVVQGFFKANGGCGYVKKPDVLLPNETGGPVFDPYKPLPVNTILKIKVYMGLGWLERFSKRHFDKCSPPDFYTRVGIAGVPADQKMENTNEVENDWHPKWDEEFEFRLTFPELAVLRLEVHEYDIPSKDDFGGQVCLPISELKTGFRHVTLCDKRGNEMSGVKLLLRITIKHLSHESGAL